MSQFYPQQTPSLPPEQPPENNYYYDEGDYEYEIDEDDYEDSDNSLLRYSLAFFAGGCLIFICMGCCFLLATGLWALDATVSSTPIPGSDIGLALDEPAYIKEAVVNDQIMRLTVFDVNRNASLPAKPAVEGRELIIVTIELENLNTKEDVKYSERDFLLLNAHGEAYQPIPGQSVVDGALDRGELGPEQGIDGRLVFEVLAGEPELLLEWAPRDSTSRYILLQ